MSEKVNRVREMLEKDPELAKKLESEYSRIVQSGETAITAEANIMAVKAVLDVDISQGELERAIAEAQEMDPEEMKPAAGGWCFADYHCYTAYRHPDEVNKDKACAYNWMCVLFWKAHLNDINTLNPPSDSE